MDEMIPIVGTDFRTFGLIEDPRKPRARYLGKFSDNVNPEHWAACLREEWPAGTGAVGRALQLMAQRHGAQVAEMFPTPVEVPMGGGTWWNQRKRRRNRRRGRRR